MCIAPQAGVLPLALNGLRCNTLHTGYDPLKLHNIRLRCVAASRHVRNGRAQACGLAHGGGEPARQQVAERRACRLRQERRLLGYPTVCLLCRWMPGC